MRVAFLGQVGSHSEGATIAEFGGALERVPCASFPAVFAAVAAGAADRGLLPIENTLAGSVHTNYDLLLRHELQIVGEHYFAVHHCLLALPGVALGDVRQVWSHPQALDQCDSYLTALGVEREAAADTTAAARRVRDEGNRTAAAIAGRRAAEEYGLAVLAEGIADSADNFTRFLILARDPIVSAAGAPVKTSLVFSLDHVPGALYRAFAVFAQRGINLTKIESRPLRGRRWEYLFYLDYLGRQGDPAAAEALEELRRMAPFLRVLGSYCPAAG